MKPSTRWWLTTIASWCLAVVATTGAVLLVSHTRGGILASRPATRIEVRAPVRSTLAIDQLRGEVAACRADVDAMWFTLEGAIRIWPGRAGLPRVPDGAKAPPRAATMPKMGSARNWRKGAW